MFSIFKKKPKLGRGPKFSNEALADLSRMLWEEELNPTYKKNLLSTENLDFSVDSLKSIDEYLEMVHAEQPCDEELLKIGLRVGAYVGEVIRKNSSVSYNWLDFDEAAKINKLVVELELHLATSAVLWSEPDNVMFPIAKVLKFVENGNEDSVYYFVKVVLSNVTE